MQVDAWVSVGCPYCGQTNAVHVTQGDIDQGIQFAACRNCNKHFSVYWQRKGGTVFATDIRRQKIPGYDKDVKEGIACIYRKTDK